MTKLQQLKNSFSLSSAVTGNDDAAGRLFVCRHSKPAVVHISFIARLIQPLSFCGLPSLISDLIVTMLCGQRANAARAGSPRGLPHTKVTRSLKVCASAAATGRQVETRELGASGGCFVCTWHASGLLIAPKSTCTFERSCSSPRCMHSPGRSPDRLSTPHLCLVCTHSGLQVPVMGIGAWSWGDRSGYWGYGKGYGEYLSS